MIGGTRSGAALALVLAATVCLAPGCRRTDEKSGAPATAASPGPAPTDAGKAGVALDPVVHSTGRSFLDSDYHPCLSWPEVTGVLADLEALDAAEPDSLFWFDGTIPHRAVDGALKAIAASGDIGLVPADYEAAGLASPFATLKAGGSAAERAVFDVALSAAALRTARDDTDPHEPLQSVLRMGASVAQCPNASKAAFATRAIPVSRVS